MVNLVLSRCPQLDKEASWRHSTQLTIRANENSWFSARNVKKHSINLALSLKAMKTTLTLIHHSDKIAHSIKIGLKRAMKRGRDESLRTMHW